MIKLSIITILLVLPLGLSAMINYHQAPNKKVGRYLHEGVVVGGAAGKGFSLLDLRRHFAKPTGIERIVLDFGDPEGKQLKGEPPFFSVGVLANPPRISLDLAQVQSSGIEPERLRKLLKSSPYVADASMTFDPVDLATNILIELKAPADVEVFKMKDRKSRIVIDIKGREK